MNELVASFQGNFFLSIVIAITAAFAGGIIARTLRFPLLLGYLGAGMLVGPHVVGFITPVDEVRELAEFGVVLLLFAVGVEISLRDISKFGYSIIAIGVGQISITALAGYGVGIWLGWSWEQSVVLGLVVSLSSTMVVLKMLVDRGELTSIHGRLLTGLMLIQDLAFVAMIAILPALGESGGFSARELWIGIAKASGALIVMLLVGPKILPWFMLRIAALGHRELFLLSLVTVIFVSAAISQELGLSAAVGAFLAGLAISGSDFGRRALSETVPLRDIFGALFFVSLGMLADPESITAEPGILFAIVGTVIFVKFVVTSVLTRAAGYLLPISLLVGFGMVQIGEFSFVIVDLAARLNIIGDEILSIVVMSAVITMALTPAIFTAGSRTVERIGRSIAALGPHESLSSLALADLATLRDHTIVAGLGRVGSMVVDSFRDHDIPFVVVDLDPQPVAMWKAAGYLAINGSSSAPEVLIAAGIEKASLLIIATGDPASALVTAERAREMNPNVDIVARAHSREEIELLKRAGVDEIVWPENETGLEIIRHSLLRYRIEADEIETTVEGLRNSKTSNHSNGQSSR